MFRHATQAQRGSRLLGYGVVILVCALPLAAVGLQIWRGPEAPGGSPRWLLAVGGLSALFGATIAWLLRGLRAARAQVAALVSRNTRMRVELEKQLHHTEEIGALRERALRVGHDFSNLLTVIAGHSEALAARPAHSFDSVLREAVAAIRSSVEDATRLTEELLSSDRVPAARRGPPPPQASIGLQPEAGTILVAEDYGSLRGLIRSILEAGGHTVLEARDGAEALQIAATELNRLDLVVTDINMPHVGGIELVEGLRMLRPELRVLYISGYSRSFDEALLYLEPNTSFLPKPFTTAGLLSAVGALMAKSMPEPAPASR